MRNTIHFPTRLKITCLSTLALPFVFLPYAAIGQETNFGKLALGPDKTSGILRGSTGGSTSLPAIVSNTDRHNKKCLGFGDPKPDHLLVLQEPFKSLSIRVRSAVETTLVVQGSDGSIRCGNDLGSNRNAIITDQDWGAGGYRIWVGTTTPGVRRDYTLIVQPE